MNLHPICEASQQHTPIVTINICILTHSHTLHVGDVHDDHMPQRTEALQNKKTELRY